MRFTIGQLDFDRDFVGFVELSQSIYGAKAVSDESLYRWLFAENVFNPPGGHLFHVARDGNRVVASDGLVPVPLVIGGRRCLAAWSVKTMTHPAYQRQGIFTALTQYGLERAQESGIELVLGFANASSYPGYEKFGWRFLFERRATIRPIDIETSLSKRPFLKPLARTANRLYRYWDQKRVAALSKKSPTFKTVVYETAPAAAGKLWAKALGASTVAVERLYPYLAWRYNQRPNQDYRFIMAGDEDHPEAMLIFRLAGQGICFIIDYLGSVNSAALPLLLAQTMDYCQAKAVRYILNSSGPDFDRRLQKYGYRPLAAALANNMLIAYPLTAVDHTILANESNWQFGYGDSELDIDLLPQLQRN